MKKGIILLGLLLSSTTFVSTAKMSSDIENRLITVCKAATKDNLVSFNRILKENRINKKRVFPKLVCNNQSLHDFALAHSATKVAGSIARYTQESSTEQLVAFNNDAANSYTVNF